MDKYIPTGNETVSLPTINERTAAIETVSFLTMAHRGLVELRGGQDKTLIQPFVTAQGGELPLGSCVWRREHDWIPHLELSEEGLTAELTVLSPVGERGFALRWSFRAQRDITVTAGIRGCWGSAWHCINEDKPIEGSMHCRESGWNDGIVFDYSVGFPAFAFAPMCSQSSSSSFHDDKDGIDYELTSALELTVGEEKTVCWYWGFGYEEVSAATSAKEMLRRGWDWEYNKTAAWLDKRRCSFSSERLTRLYNQNLFFCMFYSTGVTLDTEELVCVTSRSSRYYVSAAYWDRDTLLWAFPAVLEADSVLAGRMLRYAFTNQRRNFGVHSRYIDGTVLEPGFELDELMAPVIALGEYVNTTGERAVLQNEQILEGIESILIKLAEQRQGERGLYSTFLQPTDDEIKYPYLTYDNVLVWKALTLLAELYPQRYGNLAASAASLRAEIYNNCVFNDADGREYFAWSVDLKGRHDVYDEPPGSLQLLPYYGFCGMDEPVWLNTVSAIRSPEYGYSFAGKPIAEIGCPHAPYPWVLSICNSLLCGHGEQALRELELITMDNLIACESVDAENGQCMTGAAFATCAGFLCHAIRSYAGGDYAK